MPVFRLIIRCDLEDVRSDCADDNQEICMGSKEAYRLQLPQIAAHQTGAHCMGWVANLLQVGNGH